MLLVDCGGGLGLPMVGGRASVHKKLHQLTKKRHQMDIPNGRCRIHEQAAQRGSQ